MKERSKLKKRCGTIAPASVCMENSIDIETFQYEIPEYSGGFHCASGDMLDAMNEFCIDSRRNCNEECHKCLFSTEYIDKNKERQFKSFIHKKELS